MHAIVLKAQIRIEPQRRRYSPEEEERLLELFGEAPQWGESLRPFLWTHVTTTVAAFTGSTEIDLPVTCTYDFEVAAAKYLHSLGDGDIPLVLLFNGTTFSVPRGRPHRAADRLERRGRPPAPRVGVARHHGHVLPEQRVDPAPAGDDRRPHPLQGRPRPHVLGGHLRAAPQGSRAHDLARPLRAGPTGGRRRAVGGLRPLPVPRVRGQEPGALAVRGPRPEALLRGRRLRALDDADRVRPGVRSRGAAST